MSTRSEVAKKLLEENRDRLEQNEVTILEQLSIEEPVSAIAAYMGIDRKKV